jgi:hypothetical protein
MNLLVAEYIFDHHHTAEILAIGLFVQYFFLAGSLQLGLSDADAELLLAMFANKYQ